MASGETLERNVFEDIYVQRWLERRKERACDACRMKNARCDGVCILEIQCSACQTNHTLCTYIESKNKLLPDTQLEILESRLELLETYVSKTCPSINFIDLLQGKYDHILEDSQNDAKDNLHLAESVNIQQPEYSHNLATSSLRNVGNEDVATGKESDDEQDHSKHFVLEELAALGFPLADIPDAAYRNEFFGEASEMLWITYALSKADQLGLSSVRRFQSLRRRFWSTPKNVRYNRFPPQNYKFPTPRLLRRLIDIYYEYINIVLPMLHKPTFLKQVASGLHQRDDTFGAVVLLVCACAAPLCDDPEIFSDAVDSPYKRGWNYFAQVTPLLLTTHVRPAHLHLLQIHALALMFLKGSTSGNACWSLLGIGLSIAQSIGAHRRQPHTRPTVESELLKRAFWVLVCMDRILSQMMGRPVAIRDEDFDADLPIECDDEYWDHPDPKQRFKQPPNKRTTVTYFIYFLRLIKIVGFALRTIYPTSHSKVANGYTQQKWREHFVVELDSALQRWFHSLPSFLCWDPNAKVNVFYTQAATLRAYYYYTKILIHRKFMSSPSKTPTHPFPSLAVCSDAARSCIQVIETHYRRVGYATLPYCIPTVMVSGVITIQCILVKKIARKIVDIEAEMLPLRVLLATLKEYEERWEAAGRVRDTLTCLTNKSGLSLDFTETAAGDRHLANPSEAISESPHSEISSLPGDRDTTGEQLHRWIDSEAQKRLSGSMTPLRYHTPSLYQDDWETDEPQKPRAFGGFPFNDMLWR